MNFAPKHVVAMVASVSAAVVLAPVGVMAATGTLVNLTDPVDSSRKARVSGISGLYVDTRPRATAGSFHVLSETITDVATHPVKQTPSPNGIAVTSVVATVKGDNSASTNHVRLYSRVRTSGNSDCANGTGWTVPKALVTLSVPAGSTSQLVYDGPPIVVAPPATGQAICVGVQQTKWTGSTSTDIAVTGFTFT
jgi:hypothetical protein